jgi:hypothetical protein
MLQARALIDAGTTPRAVTEATRSWGYREQLLAGVRRYTLDELLAFPAKLLRADRTLKSRSIRGGAVLEDLVHRLTARAGSGADTERS